MLFYHEAACFTSRERVSSLVGGDDPFDAVVLFVAEDVVALQNIVKWRAVGDQGLRADLSGLNQVDQVGNAVRVHEAHADLDVFDPELVHRELKRLFKHAGHGHASPRADIVQGRLEGRRAADGLDAAVGPASVRELFDLRREVAGLGIQADVGVAVFHGKIEPLLDDIDRDHLGGAPEPRAGHRADAHGAAAGDEHGLAGLDLGVFRAEIAGGEDVAHKKDVLVGKPVRNDMAAEVGVRDPQIFGLAAVDRIPEKPAAGVAVGIEPL